MRRTNVGMAAVTSTVEARARGAKGRAAVRLGAGVALLGFGGLAGPGCLDRPLGPIEPRTTSTLVETLTQSKVDKIDILLTIDDSRSMADKQAILALAVPNLVAALANPPCMDANGAATQPSGPLADCAAGSYREFDPVLDIHVGIVSSSLGARGSSLSASACPDDKGELVFRGIDKSATYDGLGFLAWDPAQQLQPPGIAQAPELDQRLSAMVAGVGENGCGYEAQLESWYRFLIDPEPYASVLRDGKVTDRHKSAPDGIDGVLLEQRQEFLRPDSLVAIVMLTDENDCSFRADGYGWFTGENDAGTSPLYPLRARAECATDPSDACCAPCGHAAAGCPDDPSCSDPVPPDHTRTNLNCFHQKQRYGIDLLYPIDRYVAGLTQAQVPDRAGNLVDNPLLVGQLAGKRFVRDAGLVFLAGIVGVPWQDVARRGQDGRPDLGAGLKTASELDADGVWPVILGDPAHGKDPTDPHMAESIGARIGQDPVTGDTLAPIDAATPTADAINGHEFDAAHNTAGDLQYACIFELPVDAQRLCSGQSGTPCDCNDATASKSPLCQAADGSYSNLQLRAKAYPGLRELGVLHGIGDQAIVASICPRQVQAGHEQDADFGYKPAIGALTERLKERLGNPCLARSFNVDADGQVTCLMLEGRSLGAGESCSCQSDGRAPVDPGHAGAVAAAAEDPVSVDHGLDCFCEIPQLDGAEGDACRTTPGEPVLVDGQEPAGWCYVDATSLPPIGNPALVAQCPAVERRTIRFLGAGRVASGATLFLTCQQETQ